MTELNITLANVFDCEETLRFLRKHLERLVQMTEEYPVICEFCGIRQVFCSKGDIEATIDALDEKIAAFRAAA